MAPPTARNNLMQGTGSFRPNQLQELLLKAALMPGNQSLDAWREWRAQIQREDLDEGSLRILPLVYHNLRSHGIQDPFLRIAKELFQATWYANEILFYRMQSLLDSLDRNGIEALLFKGAPIALRHYPDPGLRPMEDIDLLVHKQQAHQAIELFIQLGWVPAVRPAKQLGESYFDLFRALCLSHDIMHKLDLHWRVLYSMDDHDLSDGFWESALVIDMQGKAINVPNDTEMLLHTCICGIRWDPVPTFRWVADAMMIIAHDQRAIDWDRMIHLAARSNLELPLRHALSYLKETFNAPVPPDVLSGLYDLRVSNHECKVFESSLYDPSMRSPLQVMRFHHAKYLKATEQLSWWLRICRFPYYLQMAWNVSHPWKVPFAAFIKAINRVRQSIFLKVAQVFKKKDTLGLDAIDTSEAG